MILICLSVILGLLLGYYARSLMDHVKTILNNLTPKKQDPTVVWPQKPNTSGVKTGGVIRPKTQAMLDAEREAQVNRELGL